MTRLSWHFREDEIEKDLQRLQQYKLMIVDNINIALSYEQSKQLRDLTVSVSEVEKWCDIMLADLHTMDASINRLQRTGDTVIALVESTKSEVIKSDARKNGKSTLM